MEIQQLRYFIEICRSGSMAEAARQMHITQQGISIAIRRLEAELKHELFYQRSKSLYLTEFGTALKPMAETVVADMDALQRFVDSGFEEGKARIRIAIIYGIITKLPASLQALLLTPPEEYEIELIEAYSEECAEMVQNGSADFALVYGTYDQLLYNSVILESLEQVFITNRKGKFADRDEITIQDLDRVPLIIPDSRTFPGRVIAAMFQQAGARLKVAYECNIPHQAIEMVTENPNLVARTLRSDLSEKDLERVKPLHLKDQNFTIDLNLLSKKGKKQSVHKQLFMHLITDCYL